MCGSGKDNRETIKRIYDLTLLMQVFEDIESKFTTTENLLLQDGPPLLVMIYEFERGEGTIDMSTVDTYFISSDI